MTTENVADYYLKNGALTLTSTSGATLSSNLWVQDSNTDGTAGDTLIASGTVLATWATGTNAIVFGNYRVAAGEFITSSRSLTNTALATGNNKTQALAATGTTTGGISLTGLPSPYLSVGETQDFTIGLSSGQTGPNSGTATISFTSVPGTSDTTGTTAVGSGTIAVSGTGYDWANAKYASATLNFGNIHVGGTAAAQTIAIGNQTVTNAAYQDSLDVSAATGNALVTATGFSGLAASTDGTSTQHLVVAVDTGSVGSLASTVALSLGSNANGVAGLSNGTATVVGAPGAITTAGQVYSGQSIWNTNGSGQWGTLASNFGTNWQEFNGSPGLDGSFTNVDTATFGDIVTSGTATVTLTSATPSVRALAFDNANASYALTAAEGGALTLLNTGTNAATLNITTGTHSMAVPVTLGSNVALDVGAAALFTISGVATGSQGLTKTGGGTLELLGANAYTGPTVLSAGTLEVSVLADGGTASSFGQSSSVAANLVIEGGSRLRFGASGSTDRLFTLGDGGGILDTAAGAAAMLTGTGAVVMAGSNARVLELTGGGSGSLAAVLADLGAGAATSLLKTGTGTWSLMSAQTFTGNTTVDAGTLQFGPDASLASSLIIVKSQAFIDARGKAAETLHLNDGQTLQSGGTVQGNLVVGTGSVLAPGASTGTTTTTGTTEFSPGGTFEFEINNATGAAGSTTSGWDLLITGSLSITATAEIPHIINIVSLKADQSAGLADNFDQWQSYEWRFVTASEEISNFNASFFSINTSDFQNDFQSAGGTFSVRQNKAGEDPGLFIVYYAPEPHAWVLAGLGLMIAGWVRRQRAAARRGDRPDSP